tara:strand:+ start:11762 stop:12472 length:711 start_codon:yes stop_codon:yes gene_type:complete
MYSLINKNIIVTGATSGIGKCLTKALLNSGANVAFCGKSENKMKSFLTELDNPHNCYYETFDISNEDAIIDFVNNVKAHMGSVDTLVNCAGANGSRGFVSDIKTNDLELMIRVNMIAPFIFIREVYNSMKIEEPGMFINVLSTVCNFSNEGIGAYTASKAGYDALVKVFRKEVREKNKRVCSIYPGGVDSPFREEDRPDYLNVEDVAKAILSMMLFDKNASVDELVIRPVIEKNYS